MISARTHRAGEGKDEYEVPIEVEDKKIDEVPRSSTAPKEEITINISIFAGIMVYLLMMYFFMVWNSSHYQGFFFGRLT